MVRGKRIRNKGKLKFSEYFKKLVKNDTVAIVKEPGVKSGFPSKVVGSTGKVIGDQGRCKIVELSDGNKMKKFIVHPIHLKKIGGKNDKK